jgi:RimJ/RimL family protein N-acetyltransferase
MDEECRAGNAAAFAITLAGTGEVCGVIGLRVEPEHRRAELGFWLGVPYWGRGYCTEAAQAVVAFGFEVLKLNRIYAGHFKGNTASQRVMLKLGMRHEGCFRQHILKWDRFVDLENYALLASEFATRPTVK